LIRVICVGNRFYYPDNFAILIYEELKKLNLKNVEVIEGGVGGVSLIGYFDDDADILIIDYGKSDKKILTDTDIKKLEVDEYNHSNSFLYLLKMIDKKYKIYLCNEDFDTDNLEKYLLEILDLIKGM